MERPPIICNTGPLIALSLVGLDDILGQLFEPAIPEKVFQEWKDGHPERNLLASIPVLEAPPVDSLLALQLDPGEASVIQLALKRSVPNVLIDERKGRKIARRVYGLHTIGTARVLVEARQAGLIAEIAPLFDRLREESYWIADPIVKWAKSAAGET